MTVKHALAALIHGPDAGLRRAGHIVPNDHFDGQDFQGLCDNHVGVRIVDDVVGANVLRLVEPETGRLRQHLSFVGNGRQYMVKGRLAVGGDHHASPIRQVI